jgi:homoserine dehydrogenase
LAERFGIQFQIVGVSDFKLGSLFDPNGLSPAMLLEAAAKGDLTTVPAAQYGWSVETMLAESNADTLVEVSFTDLETGQPALGYIQQALQKGMHIATTNKGPIALHFPELRQLAQSKGVQIGFEGTVMSGTPSLFVGRSLLSAAGITRIQGILNGTTNFILTRMEEGDSYAEALAEAQARGYAEADPTGDVEGHDAAGKMVILSNLVLDSDLTLSDVECQGITGLTSEDIEQAQQDGKRWKLIGSLEKADGRITASVRPVDIPLQHPLASVSGATNAITFSTTTLGDITLIGPGAGRKETGYALINDLLAIHGQL